MDNWPNFRSTQAPRGLERPVPSGHTLAQQGMLCSQTEYLYPLASGELAAQSDLRDIGSPMTSRLRLDMELSSFNRKAASHDSAILRRIAALHSIKEAGTPGCCSLPRFAKIIRDLVSSCSDMGRDPICVPVVPSSSTAIMESLNVIAEPAIAPDNSRKPVPAKKKIPLLIMAYLQPFVGMNFCFN